MGDQFLAHGILPDVRHLFKERVLVAQAVLEKAALHGNLERSGLVSLPAGNALYNAVIHVEGRDEMKMVGHDHGQPEIPSAHLLVNQQVVQQGLRDRRRGEGGVEAIKGADGNEVACPRTNPGRHLVRQPLAFWKHRA